MTLHVASAKLVAYLRESSALDVSGYTGTHARIIIRIMLVFLF